MEIFYSIEYFNSKHEVAANNSEIENNLAISIYPNPVSDIIYMKNKGKFNIRIFDLSGKMLLDKNTETESIDVRNLKAGTYIINIKNSDYNTTMKFIKQ